MEAGTAMRRATIALLIVFSFLCAGCGGGGRDASVPAGGGSAGAAGASRAEPEGRLVIAMQQEPEILNTAVNSMVASVYVCNLIFSTFVKYDDRLELVPDLVEEVPTVENGGISPDHLTYTYRIRKNARWHDGVPVTSYDAKFSYEVMMDPRINVETRQGWDIVDRVETPDSHTVVFRLREPYANFVGDCFYDESVLPRHLLAGSLGSAFQDAPFHRAPVGSGPFVFKEWVPGSHIVVEANREYYGDGPYLREIVIRFVPDDNALAMQLETGEVDALDNAPNALLPVLERVPGTRVYRNPALFNEHLDLNCEHPILADRRVRRALALATDREEISKTIYAGVWIPAYGDDAPSSPYRSPAAERRYAFDPKEAQRLLREAGWVDRDGDGIRERGGAKLRLAITTTAGNVDRERTELVLREQWRRVGVDLEVRNRHFSELYASWDEGGILRRGTYDVALYAVLMPPDPSTKEGTYSALFLPPRGQNFTRIRNEELTRLLAEGSRAVDPAARKNIYDAAAVVVADEAPVIPLLWVTQIDCMPAALEGYRPNPTQSGDTWNAAGWRLRGDRP